MSTKPTTFPRFPNLPQEVRLQIWGHAISANSGGRGRTIRIHFRQILIFEPARTILAVAGNPQHGIVAQPRMNVQAHVRYTFSIGADSLHTTFRGENINREVRQEFYPNTLQLNSPDGQPTPIIRFRAELDTIFMDLQSLRALYDFARPARIVFGVPSGGGFGPPDAVRRQRLIGFDHIQRLATPMEGPLVDGITLLRQRIFTGLTRPVRSITDYPGTDGGSLESLTRDNFEINPSILNDPAQTLLQCRVRLASYGVVDQMNRFANDAEHFIQPLRSVMLALYYELLQRHAVDSTAFFRIAPPSPPPPPAGAM